jgi:hypothetical protein
MHSRVDDQVKRMGKRVNLQNVKQVVHMITLCIHEGCFVGDSTIT